MESHDVPRHGFRTFVILWLTQSVSMIGSNLAFFAMTIFLAQGLYPLAEQKAELGIALSAVSIAFGLPAVLIAPIAGAWVDRHDRRLTMLVSDLAMAAIAGGLLLLLVSDSIRLWNLVILVAALSTANAFHSAAFDTSYVMLVDRERLPRANGMMQTAWSFAAIVAPVLAAMIIALPGMARAGSFGARGAWLSGMPDGTALVIGIDAFTFALSALVLAFLRIPSPRRSDLKADGKPAASLWADVREGALYITRRRPLLWLLGTFTVANFTMATNGVLIPMIVKFNLAESTAALGLTLDQALGRLGSIAGIGGLLGGLLVSTWGGLKQRRVVGVLLPLLISAIAIAVYGFSTAFYLTVAMAFLLQFTIPVANAHSQSIWQAQTPRELQGRVFSVRRLIAWVSNPVATALAGLMGGLLNPGHVVGVLGSVAALFMAIQLFNPILLRVEDKAGLDAMAERAAVP